METSLRRRYPGQPPQGANRKFTKRLAAGLVLLCLTGGCRTSVTESIIIFCSPDSPRMRQAIDGLKAGLGPLPLEVICVPEFGPEGQEQLRQIRPRRPRLLVVLGTPALMCVAPVEKEVPVVFALVANPYFTGAAYNPAHPEDHQEDVTGIASPAPLAAALKQGAGLLGQAPWGMLYDPNDGVAADLARQFDQEAPRFGLTPLTEPSADAGSDGPALERLRAKGAKVIYLPPTASAARYAPLVLEQGRARKVMVVSSYPEGSHAGAVLWVALDYRRLGEEAAALAKRVLAGEAPKKIPIRESVPVQVEVDEKLVRHWSGYPGWSSQ